MSQSDAALAGKTAIVTGAGGGIGRAIAQAFAAAGAQVACVDIDAEKAAATAAGCGGLAIEADVSQERAVAAAASRVAEVFGRLDILVNDAAAADPAGSVVDLDAEAWDRVVTVNLRGAFLMSKYAIPIMSRSGGGSIIHIASQLGHVGAPGRAVYCAAKGALIQLAKAMAIDHAAQNIRVNSLSPGAIETDRLLLRFSDMAAARRGLGGKHVLGRLGLPEEIAAAAVFLAGAGSSFMTGADLLVDGGYTAL